jgi:hypothetical protein
MSLKEYMKAQSDYLHDNPNNYWFKAKLYGWGWTPVRWEGWAVIAIFLVLILAVASRVDENAQPKDIVWTFFVPLGSLVALLIAICYAKGERPRWQWGPPKKDK